jgi:hypothetical protein
MHACRTQLQQLQHMNYGKACPPGCWQRLLRESGNVLWLLANLKCPAVIKSLQCLAAIAIACSTSHAGSRCRTFLGGGFALLLRLPIELPRAPPSEWQLLFQSLLSCLCQLLPGVLCCCPANRMELGSPLPFAWQSTAGRKCCICAVIPANNTAEEIGQLDAQQQANQESEAHSCQRQRQPHKQ